MCNLVTIEYPVYKNSNRRFSLVLSNGGCALNRLLEMHLWMGDKYFFIDQLTVLRLNLNNPNLLFFEVCDRSLI